MGSEYSVGVIATFWPMEPFFQTNVLDRLLLGLTVMTGHLA
jgi:hypothetical protein